MAIQFPIIDPDLVKPVIEAMIFASEEPLPVRTLIRLLAGEKPERKKAEEPPLLDLINAGGKVPEAAALTEAAAIAENIAQAEEVVEEHPEEAPEPVEGEEAASEEEDKPQPLGQKEVRGIIEELNNDYDETGRAFRIVEIAGGFQFATTKEYGEYVGLISQDKMRRRLSPASLETLAIIAYRQPITKPEAEAIRGVNCDQVLYSLLEKNLIAITGRSEAVGRPLLYGTTDEFLRAFGLNSLTDLPKLREIEELMEDDAYSAEKVEVVTVDEESDVEEIEAKVGAAGRKKAHEDEDEARDSQNSVEESDGQEPEEAVDEMGQPDDAEQSENAVEIEEEEPVADEVEEEEVDEEEIEMEVAVDEEERGSE